MAQIDVLVSWTEPIGPFVRVVFRGQDSADARFSGIARTSPGQFVLALLDRYLRTPLFPTVPAAARAAADAGANDTPEEVEVLVPRDHPAAQFASGTTVNLLGPLGHGYAVGPHTRRLLLVAQVRRLPVLLPLALQALAQEQSVALLVESPSVSNMLPIRLLPPALEVRLVTQDGSAGQQGTAVDLFPDLARWADCICLADDPQRYPRYADLVHQVRVGPARGLAQALVLPPLACGVGACQGCAVATKRGMRLACSDGPVFDLMELL